MLDTGSIPVSGTILGTEIPIKLLIYKDNQPLRVKRIDERCGRKCGSTPMKISIGILQVTLPYSYQRGKVIYYQRAIPGDLQERCGAKRVKIKLDTENLHQAAKQIIAINKGVEAEWKATRLLIWFGPWWHC